MLYDNALLARAYLHGWQALGHERYRRVCEETLDWMLREMRGPEGGFYSALDADSEGEEGRFYVWTPEQIRDGPRRARPRQPRDRCSTGSASAATSRARTSSTSPAAPAAEPRPRASSEARRALLRGARRSGSGRGSTTSASTSWNALAIARPGRGRRRARPRATTSRPPRACAEFVLGSLRDDDGRLLRTYKDGDARLNAYLEDHAFLLEALLTLYEASFEPRWFEQARALADTMIERFGDPERGGFFSTSDDHEELIARRKEIGDHPIPSGNSAAALGLLRLAALTGERATNSQADGVLRLFAKPAVEHPETFAHLLRALDFRSRRPGRWRWSAPTLGELAGDRPLRLPPAPRPRRRRPRAASSRRCCATAPRVDGGAAAYVCENFACQAAGHRAWPSSQASCSDPARSLIRMAARARLLLHLPRRPSAKWVVFAVWFWRSSSPSAPANLPGKFEDAESNEATSYLPGDAESTEALDATEALQNGEIAPAVIIYRRESGLTPADFKTIEDRRRADDRGALPGRHRRRRNRRRRRQATRPEPKRRRSRLPARLRRARPRRSPASPPTTRPSSARSARETARRRSSPPTSRPKARANGSSTRSSSGATRSTRRRPAASR